MALKQVTRPYWVLLGPFGRESVPCRKRQEAEPREERLWLVALVLVEALVLREEGLEKT